MNYQVLKNGKAIIDCANLETAVAYVRSLESELIRGLQHSPYTIEKSSEVSCAFERISL